MHNTGDGATQVHTSRRIVYGNKTTDDFALPELPDPPVPAVTSAGGESTQDIYRSLREARRQIDLPEGEANFRAALRDYPGIARAMFSVLLESRKIVAPDGSVVEPPPLQPPPTLPVGLRSWLQPRNPR